MIEGGGRGGGGGDQILHFLRKRTSGLEKSPGYVFWLTKLKNDIKIALKSTGIKL